MAIALHHLNARQREAVLHPLGPLLILAGAGSGKTSTMAYRIAHLIVERHVSPTEVLGLSFTNKAARELKQRVSGLISKQQGSQATRGLTITTFHSLCVRILRAHAGVLGFQNNFTILDQNDQLDILKQVLRNIQIDERRFDPDVILFEISQAKNRFYTPAQAETYFLESSRLSQDYAIAAASSFGRYQEQLRALNAMDFDDLIFHTVSLLQDHASVRDHYGYRFRHILVDEYQDTNPAQFKILKLLTEKQQNLCVVGDDDQSIYAWRGADPSHILQFSRYFPAAKTITLDQNYRSTSKILEAANQVIANNNERYPKKLWSDRGEGEPIQETILQEDRAESEFVGEEILWHVQERSRPWSDFAILYRSNAQSRVFEEALRRRQIPYKIVGGLSFLERKEVKDTLAYLRLAVNPKDDASLRRIINWPARGIGRTSIETLGTEAFQRGVSFFEVLPEAPRLTPKTAELILGFKKQIDSAHLRLKSLRWSDPASVNEGLVQWMKQWLLDLKLKEAIFEESDDPVQASRKWDNVQELLHSVGQFSFQGQVEVQETGSPQAQAVSSAEAQNQGLSGVPAEAGVLESQASISESQSSPEQASPDWAQALSPGLDGLTALRSFLQIMMLQAQEEEKDEQKDSETAKNQVTLLTFHGAKGLEFPVVFMVGMEEGFLPHQRTLDEATDLGEERRLCYVGITRARDQLYLSRAKTRIRYGKPVPRNPSRFLEEIPKDLLLRENQALDDEPTSKEAEQEHEVKVKSFLDQIRANLMKK
ncbi:MAG: ATP-dependent helicase [Bdellovibrionia bacterium]